MIKNNALIIRPHENAKITANQLAIYSIGAVIVPAFTIENLHPNISIKGNLLPKIFIATSQNAILAYQQLCLKNNSEESKIKTKKAQSDICLKTPTIIVNGENSFAMAQNSGFTKIIKAGQVALDVLDFIKNNFTADSHEFIYLAGDNITLDISNELTKLGYIARKIIIYHAIENVNFATKIRKNILEHKVNLCLLFSSRAADLFIKNFTDKQMQEAAKTLDIFTLSKKIAMKLSSQKFKSINWVDNNSEALYKLIGKFYL